MNKQIAFEDNTTSVENLPYPYVLYPGFYGAFFGFKKDSSSEKIYFCSCSKVAIENYITFRLSTDFTNNTIEERRFILDSMYFPISFVRFLISKGISQNKDVIEHIPFKDKLCHECNKVIPSYRYCHEMYGGIFKQTYGWYINKQGLELGIEPGSNKILGNVCPEEISDLIEFDSIDFWNNFYEKHLTNNKNIIELEKKYNKQVRKIWRAIENEVRIKFDVKKVGEAWANETLLYNIVKNLLPNQKILRHHRPDWLERLELDIFLPTLNIGIEYQGIQHYKPIKHWGGKEALKKTKERDKKKQYLCQKNNIILIYFYHYEQLSNELVEKKLSAYLKTPNKY